MCSSDGCERPARVKGMCRPCYDADYHRKNAALKCEAAAVWRRDNPDRVKELNAAWRAANADREREQKRAYRAANPERIRESSRQRQMRRKARKRGCVVTDADYAEILAEFGMVCHICDGEIESKRDLHFDHVIPLSRGGAHSRSNIRPSHALCNRRKGNQLMKEMGHARNN